MTMLNEATLTIDEVLDGATPERIAIAGDDVEVVEGHARRFTDTPLQRLAKRGQLFPDADTNKRLLEAGERYYADWYLSGMSPIGSFDPTRVYAGGGGGSNCGMPASVMQAKRRASHRAARAVLGKLYAAVVDPIILHEQEPVAVGRVVANVKAETLARAIATERLRAGLYMLARHYGDII
jgi:hypothetical protein